MTDVKRPYTLTPGQRGPMRREMAPMPAIPRQSDFGIHEVSFILRRFGAFKLTVRCGQTTSRLSSLLFVLPLTSTPSSLW